VESDGGVVRKNIKDQQFIERRKSNYDAQAARIKPLPFKQRNARILMTLALLASDVISLWISYGIAIWLHDLMIRESPRLPIWNVFPILFFFLVVYALYGLYPGVGLSPVHEIKQLFMANNIIFLLLIAITFWQQTSTNYSRFILAAVWLIALVLVQLNRWLTRIVGRSLEYWGEPVAIVGNGPQGLQIEKYLMDRIRLGMRPVLLVDGYAKYEETPLVAINRSSIRTIILVMPEISAQLQKRFINDQRFGYHRRRGEKNIPRLIMISSLGMWGSLGVRPVDLDGRLGLEIPNNLMQIDQRVIKRGMDLLLVALGGILILPVLLLISLAIKLDSPGSIFYKQKRLGRDGKYFFVWKFRTMLPGAEDLLKKVLKSDPVLKAEWDLNHKLKHDPRVTRVGRILRKWSLDELPQIFNILSGEMSIVGPRPFVDDESSRYRSIFEKYKKVRPGMTGLWQVSGRNDTTYDLRVQMDEYYIHNWSPWLDIYIILRTVGVVLLHRGAY
jgi:Undecaprenyl-phosphate galactose phosphotransferase WbaP